MNSLHVWLDEASGWRHMPGIRDIVVDGDQEYQRLVDFVVDDIAYGDCTGPCCALAAPPPGPTPIERAFAILAPHLVRERLYEPGPSSFTCPVCGRTSHHPMDRKYGYCGACHDYTATPEA